MLPKKLDLKLVLSIGGTLLGLAGTALSGMASNKAMDEEIQKKVAEEVAKQLKK